MNALCYILEKYGLKIGRRTPMPIEIPNVGRDDLALLFAELEFKVGVEIGVLGGQYNEVLCKANPNARIYGVDPWVGYDEYKDFAEPYLSKFHAEALARLSKYSNSTLVQKFSMDAVNDFKDDSLDFVYLDGNHELPHVIEDVYKWSTKVRPGGIISGHDYYKMRRLPGHVIEAVVTWTRCFHIRPWFVFGLGAKVQGQVRDWSRSWMWVKAQ